MRHLSLGVVIACGSVVLSEVEAQPPQYKPFEFQVGAQFPLSSVRHGGVVPVTQATGLTLGALIYSYLDDPIGFRIRADMAVNSITARTADASSTKGQLEFSVGVDVSPRFSRFAVKVVEARFYAGTAFRLIDRADDVCIVSGQFWCDDPVLIGSRADLIGRAGWFIRRKGKASVLRLDVGYQYGRFSYVHHELLIRVGLGS
jgi:hypothetical protein